MPSPTRLTGAALALVVALLVTLLAALLAISTGPSAVAANDKGYVDGEIICPPLAKCPKIKVLWFDANWVYRGQKNANGGGYSLTLEPGVYHLQFVDQRPAYDVTKFAPTDIKVTVVANDQSGRTVRMQKGAAVTGTVKGGGKPLGGATVSAARRGSTQSFSTVADDKGRFAIGGLPQAQYSIFTWDKRRTWVGKSTWAGSVKPGKTKNFPIRLTRKAGNLTLRVFTPDGLLQPKTTITVTSKQTGQWWSATSGTGTFVFKGLYPGGYHVQFNGAGVWFAKTGTAEQTSVKSGRMDFGSFHLTKRGGWLTGTVVDAGDGTVITDFPMKGVVVGLYNADGDPIASATTDEDGRFELKGQLVTQSGLMVTIDPNMNGGGWMQAAEPDNWCLFVGSEVGEFGITQGEGTEIGPIGLPRSTDRGQSDQCLVPTPATR